MAVLRLLFTSLILLALPAAASAQQRVGFCSANAEVSPQAPSADVPEQFRQFLGNWVGTETEVGTTDGPCFAFVIEKVAADGVVTMTIFNGNYSPWNMSARAGRRDGKISGNVLVYDTNNGRIYLTHRGDHLELSFTSQRGRNYTGKFKKV